jgi:hypothetical protein
LSNFDYKDIKSVLHAFKDFKAESGRQVRFEIKARIRSLMGVRASTSGKRFDKALKKLEEEYWNVSWSRFYSARSDQPELCEWVCEIGSELYLLRLAREQEKGSYDLLNTFLRDYLFGYVRSLVEMIYTDKTLVVQKSEEVFEKVIYRVIQNIDRYSPYKAGFVAWTYAITRNILRTPEEKAYESTDLILDLKNESDDDVLLYRIASDEQSPADVYAENELGILILETLFAFEGYPWQILVEGLMKLGYKPGEIVAKYSEKSLGEIFNEFVAEFSAASFRTDEELSDIFKPLRLSLKPTLDEIVLSTDPRTRKKFKFRLDERCCDIRFKDFFGEKPNKNVSEWDKRIVKKVRKKMEEAGFFQK